MKITFPLILTVGLLSAALFPSCASVKSVDANSAVAAEPQTTPAPPSGGPTATSWAGTVPAPDFPDGLDWLNVAAPLSMADLRGKVVLLDFWTYGCINCIHNLPYLALLEKEFRDELVVIGVHSAKFQNEGKTDQLRNIVLRYDLTHPIVNDGEFVVWNIWGANAWPTLVLIDPAGNVVGGRSGEGFYDTFREVILSLIAEFDAKGLLRRGPLPAKLERSGLAPTVLRYPGKVIVDPATGILFVADTGNHRIVAVGPDGEVRFVLGSGTAGFVDGDAATAAFNDPHGLALSSDGRSLFVADTGNHAIRGVDLGSGRVTTLAGTGKQAEAYPPEPGVGTSAALSSPWDVVVQGSTLFIAMAGSHQLWRLDLAGQRVWPLSGSGYEGFADGPGGEAELAQPSGLSIGDDGRLYFADSEGSSVRFASLADGGVVTLAGSGASLFEFGAEDGVGKAARFQHPLGVAYHRGLVYVADTYNSRIRVVDPDTGRVTTLAGTEPGFRDGVQPLFDEPGGIAAAGGVLYVADTNNHAIRKVDAATGTTSTLILKSVERLGPPPQARRLPVTLSPVTVGPGRGTAVVDVRLPAGFKLNDEAASSFELSSNGAAVTLQAGSVAQPGVRLPLEFDAVFAVGTASIRVDLTLVYCEVDKESLCYLERASIDVPVTVRPDAPGRRVVVTHRVEGRAAP